MHLHCLKERLKIRKLTKFKGDTLKASEGLVAQSRREIFLTFVWWGGGAGHKFAPFLQTGLRRAISSSNHVQT